MNNFGKLLAGAAIAAAAVGVAPASAEQICGVQTHTRYGETRAFFSDVWAGCKTDSCQISASRIDKSLPVNISHEVRFKYEQGQFGVSLTAVMDAVAIGEPTKLSWGKKTTDLTGFLETRDNVVNQFHVKDDALAEQIARDALAHAKMLKWSYVTRSGEAKTIAMPARGGDKALAWIECMSAKKESTAERQAARRRMRFRCCGVVLSGRTPKFGGKRDGQHEQA